MAALIVVKHDAIGTFQHLRATLAHTLVRDVELIWDRRASDRRRPGASVAVERRVRDRREAESEPALLEPRRMERREQPEARMPERRRAERRRREPDTWRTLGFVLVQQDCPAGV
jgi:hypothetical protein